MLLIALAGKLEMEQTTTSTYPGNHNAGKLILGNRSTAFRALNQLADRKLITLYGDKYSVNYGQLQDLIDLPQYQQFMDTGLADEQMIDSFSPPYTPVEVVLEVTPTPPAQHPVPPVVDELKPKVTTKGKGKPKQPKQPKQPKPHKSLEENLTDEKVQLILSNPQNLLGYCLYGPVVVGLDRANWTRFPPSPTNWAPVSGHECNWDNPEPLACKSTGHRSVNPALTAFAWCSMQFARFKEGKSITVRPFNFQKMNRQIGNLASRVGLDKAIAIIREVCFNWPAIRSRVSWMKDLVLDETVFGKQPILEQADMQLQQVATATTTAMTDANKNLILRDKLSVSRYLNWGIEGIDNDAFETLPPVSTSWSQYAEKWDDNGTVQIKQHPEKWPIEVWCGWYWCLVCNHNDTHGMPMRMIFWDEDQTRVLYENMQSTLKVYTTLQAYLFMKTMWVQFVLIQGLLKERGLKGFVLDEYSMTKKFLVDTTHEVMAWPQEKIDDETDRVTAN